MNDINKTWIHIAEKRLNEKFSEAVLLKETSCSFLYRLSGKKQYLLKKGKTEEFTDEYENHKIIYELWNAEKDYLDFKIPELYFVCDEEQFYVMEFISQGTDLQKLLQQDLDKAKNAFRRTGDCLRQYHDLTTRRLSHSKENIFDYKHMVQLFQRGYRNEIMDVFDQFEEGDYRIVHNDFKPSNVVLDSNGNIYFLDFNQIYFYAPFHYDLIRFIDTAKVFALINAPARYMFDARKINATLEVFLQGYSGNIDRTLLKKMAEVRRKEHIQMKLNYRWLDAAVLKIIYYLI